MSRLFKYGPANSFTFKFTIFIHFHTQTQNNTFIQMAISTNLLLLLQLVVISAFIFFVSPATAISGADELTWMSNTGGCKGSIGECMGAGLEMEMESESTRRILATTNYISYGALQGNSIPCSQRGASYYNCQSGAQANPYQRGCSTITRCQR